MTSPLRSCLACSLLSERAERDFSRFSFSDSSVFRRSKSCESLSRVSCNSCNDSWNGDKHQWLNVDVPMLTVNCLIWLFFSAIWSLSCVTSFWCCCCNSLFAGPELLLALANFAFRPSNSFSSCLFCFSCPSIVCCNVLFLASNCWICSLQSASSLTVSSHFLITSSEPVSSWLSFWIIL